MPKFEFCLPTNGKAVPAGPEWFHEIKFDGYRVRVERDGDRVRLITRGGYDWTKRFPWIAEAALKNRRSRHGAVVFRNLVRDCGFLSGAVPLVAPVGPRPGTQGAYRTAREEIAPLRRERDVRPHEG